MVEFDSPRPQDRSRKTIDSLGQLADNDSGDFSEKTAQAVVCLLGSNSRDRRLVLARANALHRQPFCEPALSTTRRNFKVTGVFLQRTVIPSEARDLGACMEQR